jgi:aminoglycoside 2'-N-acetyltransferase I
MEIRVIPAADISSDLYAAIYRLCARAYGEDLRALIETFDQPVHVVATSHGTVVSHAVWITRWLQPNDGPLLRSAYVEAVATDPAYQRRGFASAVLQTLLREVQDFDLAALCASDQGYPLYVRLGWEVWRGPLFIRQNATRIATPGETVMVYQLPRSPALDLDGSLSVEWRTGEFW